MKKLLLVSASALLAATAFLKASTSTTGQIILTKR